MRWLPICLIAAAFMFPAEVLAHRWTPPAPTPLPTPDLLAGPYRLAVRDKREDGRGRPQHPQRIGSWVSRGIGLGGIPYETVEPWFLQDQSVSGWAGEMLREAAASDGVWLEPARGEAPHVLLDIDEFYCGVDIGGVFDCRVVMTVSVGRFGWSGQSRRTMSFAWKDPKRKLAELVDTVKRDLAESDWSQLPDLPSRPLGEVEVGWISDESGDWAGTVRAKDRGMLCVDAPWGPDWFPEDRVERERVPLPKGAPGTPWAAQVREDGRVVFGLREKLASRVWLVIGDTVVPLDRDARIGSGEIPGHEGIADPCPPPAKQASTEAEPRERAAPTPLEIDWASLEPGAGRFSVTTSAGVALDAALAERIEDGEKDLAYYVWDSDSEESTPLELKEAVAILRSRRLADAYDAAVGRTRAVQIGAGFMDAVGTTLIVTGIATALAERGPGPPAVGGGAALLFGSIPLWILAGHRERAFGGETRWSLDPRLVVEAASRANGRSR